MNRGKKTYGNPLGRGERWVRCGVNALSLALSLFLSRQPLRKGERLVRFDVSVLSLSLSLSVSLSPSLPFSLSLSLYCCKGRKIGAAWCERTLRKGRELGMF